MSRARKKEWQEGGGWALTSSFLASSWDKGAPLGFSRVEWINRSQMALPVLWVCSTQCVCSLSRYQCASVFVYVCVCVCSAVSGCLIICSSQKSP